MPCSVRPITAPLVHHWCFPARNNRLGKPMNAGKVHVAAKIKNWPVGCLRREWRVRGKTGSWSLGRGGWRRSPSYGVYLPAQKLGPIRNL